MVSLEEQVMSHVSEYEMLKKGDRVVVGVSGGADSVCLLRVLWKFRVQLGIDVAVVHVNHQLRGTEADRDEDFVRGLCAAMGAEFCCVHADVAGAAKRGGLSLEEAGRKARYRAFEAFRLEWGGTKVAVAHNQNDLAETMVDRLSRGTGLAGLCGIWPVRGRLIRPLLCMNRREIVHYVEEEGIEYVTDSTNLSDAYTRNKIRRHVVDYLEKEVNPSAAAHMAQTARIVREALACIEAQARGVYTACVTRQGGQMLVRDALAGQMSAIRGEVLRLCLEEISGQWKDIGAVHLAMVEELFERQVGKEVCLPGGIRAVRTYDGIRFCRVEDGGARDMRRADAAARDIRQSGPAAQDMHLADAAAQDIRSEGGSLQKAGCAAGGSSAAPLSVPGRVARPGIILEARLQPAEAMAFFAGRGADKDRIPQKMEGIPEKRYTKWFDYDKISNGLILRRRMPGDYICSAAGGGRQKLKDFLINEKVPRAERDTLWLLADGQEIVWIVGSRISSRYKVTEDTKRIVQIQVIGGTDDE